MIRIASFNVENLFSRVRAMNQSDWKVGKSILDDYSRFNSLIQKIKYNEKDKDAILKSLDRLGLMESDENKYVVLHQNRGRLLKRSASGIPQVVADGRSDWIGWLTLKTEAVDETATRMTARVIQDIKADILCVIEAEDRIGLSRFNDQLLKPLDAAYSGIMLIDGNDERGIDVGLLTKSKIQIESMVSHVDDIWEGRRIFSRDCPEFTIKISSTISILVLINHFKSKGYGSAAQSNERRRKQAQRVKEIYDLRRAEGVDMIAITGDLNDTPDSSSLEPLLAAESDLRDISIHPSFVSDGRPGTYANGTASNKIDYVLLSPALFARVKEGGIFRKGVWGGTNGTLFPHFDEMTKASHAASDHAAIWAELDL